MRKKQFVQNNNNLAIAYYRFSSHAQNDQSIEQQREMAEAYAEKHGLTIIKEYPDEAISGRDDTRPQYQLLLSEVKMLKPAVLILWKTDRLGRDRFDLQIAKNIIRGAGCSIECVAEPFIDPNDPTSIFVEGILDAQAEYYSASLAQNVMRGLNFNAKNCYYNGVKTFGYTTEDLPIKGKNGKPKKIYVLDPTTSPVVRRIFQDFADGKPLQELIDELNHQGLRTAKGGLFNMNGIRHILMNRMYLGEYHYGGVVVPDGIPRIISDDLFDEVQRRFVLNKHKPKSQEARHIDTSEPRFWLTGKLFCGECKESMQGVSGTSKSGKIHYYYVCKNHRKHKCKLRPVQKDFLERCVVEVLREFLSDHGNLASLAVDVSEYAKKQHSDDTYLKSLQKELNQTEKEIKNIIDAIKQGLVSKTLQQSLTELENKQEALADAIEVEKAKLALANDDYGIKHYFEMYARADFEDDETRRMIFEYFIDKIYVFDDKLIIDMFYSDNHVEVSLEAFLASEEYAKESIKDMELSVFDQNADGSIRESRMNTKFVRDFLVIPPVRERVASGSLLCLVSCVSFGFGGCYNFYIKEASYMTVSYIRYEKK